MTEQTNTTNENGQTQKNGKAAEVEFTKEQQEKINSLIAERINATKGKYEQDIESLKAQHAKDLEDIEKKAKMTAEEQKKYDDDKMHAELEQLRAEKKQREHNDEISRLFDEVGINPSIPKSYFNHLQVESAKNELTKFKQVFDTAVADEVAKRLPNHTPKTTPTGTDDKADALRYAMGLVKR